VKRRDKIRTIQKYLEEMHSCDDNRHSIANAYCARKLSPATLRYRAIDARHSCSAVTLYERAD
jgi:hypothetical protein